MCTACYLTSATTVLHLYVHVHVHVPVLIYISGDCLQYHPDKESSGGVVEMLSQISHRVS